MAHLKSDSCFLIILLRRISVHEPNGYQRKNLDGNLVLYLNQQLHTNWA